jgi:hypothetical protein
MGGVVLDRQPTRIIWIGSHYTANALKKAVISKIGPRFSGAGPVERWGAGVRQEPR